MKFSGKIRPAPTQIQERKAAEQSLLNNKIESVQLTAEKEKEMIQVLGRIFNVKYFLLDPQKEHEDQMYALNKLGELLKKMLLNDKSAPEPVSQSPSL